MEATLIIIFACILVVFIIVVMKSNVIGLFDSLSNVTQDNVVFTSVYKGLLMPLIYMAPVLFLVLLLIIQMVYMIVNNIKFGKMGKDPNLITQKHTVSFKGVDDFNPLYKIQTLVDRNFNIGHYDTICKDYPLEKRKEFCLLYNKTNCNDVPCCEFKHEQCQPINHTMMDDNMRS